MSKIKNYVTEKTKAVVEQSPSKDEHHQTGDKTEIVRKIRNKNSPIRERMFCCHICGKTFLIKGHMTRHIRVIHEGYRYVCRIDMCYKFLCSKWSLKKHQLIHTGERPFSCKVCGESFRWEKNLNKHLRVHPGEKPYCCTECPKNFGQSQHLKQHMIIHLGLSPYVCEVCQRAFKRSGGLTLHTKTHTKEKSFSCAHCAYKSSRKDQIKKHLSKCFQKHGFEDQYSN